MTTESHAPLQQRDREVVCWTTTATGEVIQTGTMVHDDTLTGQPGTEFGWALFDQHQTPVPATTPGLTFVSCDECCPQLLGEGCWDDGTNAGAWVSIREPDGTVSVTDPATGDPVDSADVVECPGRTNESTIGEATDGNSYAVPAADLISWSVRVVTAPVSITLNGATQDLVEGESVTSTAETGGTLTDDVTVTAGTGGAAHILSSARV